MNQSVEMCCFCLGVSNSQLTDLFMKSGNGLTYFGIISSSFSQLANILNENAEYDYLFCDKCCKTIEATYQFNQSCLRNVGMYLAKKETEKKEKEHTVKIENDNPNTVFILKSEPEDKSEFPTLSATSCAQKFDYDLNDLEIKMETHDDENNLLRDPLEVDSDIKDLENDLNMSSDANKNEEEINIEQIKIEHPTIIAEDNVHIGQGCDKLSGEHSQSLVQEKTDGVIENKLNCHECGKIFYHKEVLRIHLLGHTGVKPFECHLCEKSFSEKYKLNVHILRHTGEKPFKCHLCQKSFNEKYKLNSHILTHTGVKAFECHLCEKSFTKKYKLTTHILRHTTENCFKCDVCGKRFLTKSHLSEHTRIHTGE